MVAVHRRGTGVAFLVGSAVLSLVLLDVAGAASTGIPLQGLLAVLGFSAPPPPPLHPTPPGHAMPANANFTDDELVDTKKTARLEGGACLAEHCQSHCKQKLHAAGRCDQDLCVCRDLKARGRCQVIGFGCGSDNEDGAAGRSSNIINNNNNNNNVLVVH